MVYNFDYQLFKCISIDDVDNCQELWDSF